MSIPSKPGDARTQQHNLSLEAGVRRCTASDLREHDTVGRPAAELRNGLVDPQVRVERSVPHRPIDNQYRGARRGRLELGGQACDVGGVHDGAPAGAEAPRKRRRVPRVGHLDGMDAERPQPEWPAWLNRGRCEMAEPYMTPPNRVDCLSVRVQRQGLATALDAPPVKARDAAGGIPVRASAARRRCCRSSAPVPRSRA
jgi:hypothetical protein